MEIIHHHNLAMKTEEEKLPPLIQAIAAREIAGFDNANNLHLHDLKISILDANEEQKQVSISMPSSPIEVHVGSSTLYPMSDSAAKFHSQPIPNNNKLKYQRFDSFKTWSGKLERQISNLRGKPCEIHENDDIENLPLDRFFDALEGPELDTLRASEEIILPENEKWPFLLRFPISTFGICLGVSSQAIMWKALATSDSTKFLHVTPEINLALWLVAAALVAAVSAVYSLKVIFYFEAVRREYFHPVRVNFFFAPLVAVVFLAIGAPPPVAGKLHSAAWYALMAPILCLEVKIYGQWMSGGQRRLSKVANPSNHLAVVGNFAGAVLGAAMGLKEGPVFFFAVGLAHYVVLFVTLYQRLPTNETLPKELHPVFFLFVAAPSTAAVAWTEIRDSFDHGSRIAYFIALFLYFSLAVRVNFFRGFRFSLAWWAYTFPMTGAAVATMKYADAVPGAGTRLLAVTLCGVATVAVAALLVATVVHACVLKDLFPNDMAIAISGKRPKMTRKWRHRYRRRSSSSSSTTDSDYCQGN
ncbi:S-type anion channel SLAH2-like [Andrographis paniculata]|uniref:S-type anion channel SLAH2-like n=1 Tax=Andrographis paniculata TaxID=175694 RepID=UPI0021E77DF8|nr:S-type anion channel SLAH2-like [Andrographis paniculata]